MSGISTEAKTYGWIAGVPAGMQQHPDKQKQPSQNSESDTSKDS